MISHARVLVAVAAISLMSFGCGGGERVKPNLKLTQAGKPLQTGSGELVEVALIPVAGGEQAVATPTAEPGVFEVRNADKQGIAPGQYKVAVRVLLYKPGDPKHLQDRFNEAHSTDNTKLTCQIAPGATEVAVDIPGR